jgi:hypothetical protein
MGVVTIPPAGGPAKACRYGCLDGELAVALHSFGLTLSGQRRLVEYRRLSPIRSML